MAGRGWWGLGAWKRRKEGPFIRKNREGQPWDWGPYFTPVSGRTLLSISFPRGWTGPRENRMRKMLGPDMVVVYNPRTKKLRLEDDCDFKASLAT